MLTLRIAFLTTLFVVLAACGSGPTDSTDVGSEAPDPGPGEPTTTVVDYEIEDPPLPTAPPNVTAPDDSTTTTADDDADDPEPEAATEEVAVYFLVEPGSGIEGTDVGCELAAPVKRRVGSPKVLTGAIEALLDGPTEAEAEAGYSSVFNGDIGWGLASVTITDGTASIDFTDDSEPFNNMSASCVHLALMAQLEMTATQFPTVDRAVFSVGGDITTFYHWLERDVPEL